MPLHLATSTLRGRLGAYAVDVYDGAGSGSSPAALRLEGDVVIQYGTVGRAYGALLMGSLADLTFYDPDGVLGAVGGLNHEERRYYVDVSGPNGRGGTLRWRGFLMRARRPRTMAPRIYPTGTRTLRAYDRIGALRDVPGEAVNAASLRTFLGRLAAALSARDGVSAGAWPVVGYVGAWPDNAADRLPSRLEFNAELEGEGRGEYGTMEGQTATLARAFGLTLFQPTDGAEGAPYYHLLPRWAVGLALASGAFTVSAGAPATEGTATVAARAYTPAVWDGEAAAREALDDVDQAGTIKLAGTFQAQLVADPEFDEPATYWAAGSFDPHALAAGDELSQTIFAVSPDADVRVELEVGQTTFLFDSGIPGSPEARSLGQVYLEIYAEDGTTYYGRSTGSWTTTPSPFFPDPDEQFGTDATGGDFPAAGDLAVRLEGGSDVDVDTDPVTADFLFVRARLVDGAGAPITDWVIRVGSGVGEAVEIPVIGPLQVDDGDSWENPGEWGSPLTGAAYGTLGEATAAERLAQQGRPLAAPLTTLPVLVGPEVRVPFPGVGTVPSSPFAGATPCLAVGLSLSLLYGETEGAWTEAAAAP